MFINIFQYMQTCIRYKIPKDYILLFGINGKVRLAEFQFPQAGEAAYIKQEIPV